ncbi:MAG: undecaprenyldiphospho-muramoylpentapeptide beta-N-acetylglucosaminyltransferase [candidate division Zixibacteria bacterium]|nr:undecaprenyldiphospho-muramoylpentapeptide beta-N-acetylglucosaminyltransferase [candidate division Zixibacteria bacterium]
MASSEESVEIVIAGGGTGGHLFPGLATAEALTALVPEASITFVGTGRPVEERALAGKAYGYLILPAPRLERNLHPLNLLMPVRFAWAVARAARLLRKLRAALVIGTGGYGSAPVIVASRLRRTPTIILEQNIIPGLTNRALSRLATLACLAFEPSRDWLAAGVKAVVTGNPVRPVRDAGDVAGARARLGLDAETFTAFVFGGSLGARRLVKAAREALEQLAGEDMQFIVQTGDAATLDVPPAWEGRLVVRPFFDVIYDCYRAADLVVCRAGGGVAEVLAFGKPMVLVPYPFAAHGHQERNAAYVEQEGAAVVVPDASLDGTRMASLITELKRDGGRRAAMARASRELGRPDAARRVAREALNLLGIKR